jgi:hypothetical protein
MRVSSFLQSKGISSSDTAKAISDGRVGVQRAGQPSEESITKDVEIGYGDKVLVIIGNNTSKYHYKVSPRNGENIWHSKPVYWIAAGIAASAFVAVDQIRQNRLENERKASNCIIGKQYDLCKTVDLSGIEPSNVASIRRIISQREAEIALESERYQRQVQEQRRLAVIDDNKRKAEDERRKAAIKAAEDERAYKAARIYVEWTSNSTGEVIAKATIVRKDVRSYTSLGNNKIAQVVYELFDAGDIPITNYESGFNRHEFRVNCDTREPLTRSMNVSYNSGGTGTLNFTGYMSDEVCKAAGL